jgi:hypothetical protein
MVQPRINVTPSDEHFRLQRASVGLSSAKMISLHLKRAEFLQS